MEWELFLHLITDNAPINPQYVFLSAEKSQKQGHVDSELKRTLYFIQNGKRK